MCWAQQHVLLQIPMVPVTYLMAAMQSKMTGANCLSCRLRLGTVLKACQVRLMDCLQQLLAATLLYGQKRQHSIQLCLQSFCASLRGLPGWLADCWAAACCIFSGLQHGSAIYNVLWKDRLRVDGRIWVMTASKPRLAISVDHI